VRAQSARGFPKIFACEDGFCNRLECGGDLMPPLCYKTAGFRSPFHTNNRANMLSTVVFAVLAASLTASVNALPGLVGACKVRIVVSLHPWPRCIVVCAFLARVQVCRFPRSLS
jgi:hypothetical protein